jgi:ribosomal protein S12 methylthiotransferase accessory factor
MPIEIIFDGNKKVNALINGFTIRTDQSIASGGDSASPEPFTLFIASLGTCAGIYVKSFCDQRGIDTSAIHLTMDSNYDPIQKMIVKFILHIHVPAGFPVQYEAAVIKTAALCAVKRHLSEKIENEIIIVRD